MSITKGLKVFRDSKNLSRKSLGDQLSVSGKTIENWENGKTCPDADVLALLFQQYPELNLHWLITGIGQMWLDDEDAGKAAHLEEVNKLRGEIIDLYKRLEGDGGS